MTYIKQTWVDDVTPLDAEHMNHMEEGIAAAKAGADDLILRDGVHPTVMGHQVLADAWLKYAGSLI